MSSSYSTVFCRIERLYVISGFGVYDTGLGFFFLGSTYHSCMPSPLGPHPTRVQSCVCCIFWTNRNSLAVTSFYLSHYPIRDMNPWISAISKWKYLLLLKLQCYSSMLNRTFQSHIWIFEYLNIWIFEYLNIWIFE